MTLVILLSVVSGIIGGRWVLPGEVAPYLDQVATVALGVALFGIGVDLGRSREAIRDIFNLGYRILLVPLGVAAGSLAGAVVAGSLTGLAPGMAAAVGAGFGWYSLSGIMLARLSGPEAGTLAFLTNVIREMLALLLIPLVARRLGPITAIAPGGATAMDVTLPIIARSAGDDVAVIAFLSGALLSLAVPWLVPLFAVGL